jgi:hypothetical protein
MGYRSTGDAMFFGDNRPYGALLSFWSGAGSSNAEEDGGSAVSPAMQSRVAPATIEIRDEAGAVVRIIRTTTRPGLNRVVWDLTGRGFRGPGQSERPMAGGPEVVPGTYAVKVTAGGAEANGRVEVVLDPRLGITRQERIANHEALERLGAAQERAGDALAAIDEIRSAIEAVPSRLRDRSDGVAAAIRDTAGVLVSELNGFEERFTGRRDVQGIAGSDGTVFEALGGARALGSSFHAPGPAQRLRVDQAESLLTRVVADLEAFMNDRYESFRRLARSAEVELLPAPPRIGG